MPSSFSLAYGQTPLRVALPHGSLIVDPPPAPAPQDLHDLLQSALEAPVASAPLETKAANARRITLIVSDPTRPDPRREMLDAAIARLPDRAELTLAIATGTHGPCDLSQLGLPPALLDRAAVVNHDGHSDRDLVTVGTTARGTPVRLHRCAVDTDLVVATGCIKPHYFAGYGAGCKSVFPGLGASREIRLNHELKQDPQSAMGVVKGNPCREDLEEAVAMVGAPMFLLNVVVDAFGRAQLAVAGHVREAFERGARACDPFHRVRAPRRRAIVVSDRLPFTGSLYQASKLVAAVAPIAVEGATIVVAAQCPYGTGPVDTVNRAIYEIGLRPRLPRTHDIILVSDLHRRQVEPMYRRYAPTFEAALDSLDEPPVVFPNAGTAIVDAI